MVGSGGSTVSSGREDMHYFIVTGVVALKRQQTSSETNTILATISFHACHFEKGIGV